jgi:hypothetical protein
MGMRPNVRYAEYVRLKNERGKKSTAILITYFPGLGTAHGLFTQDGGSSSPVVLSIFGHDDFNIRQLRTAWNIFLKVPFRKDPDEWSFKWAVGSFVRWLNSGGEARLAHAREARRHGRA